MPAWVMAVTVGLGRAGCPLVLPSGSPAAPNPHQKKPRRSLPLAFAATGVLAAVAETAGHLVAGLLDPGTTVLAVGSTVIDATPTPL